MAMQKLSILCAILFIVNVPGCLSSSQALDSRQSYVVYMGGHRQDVQINEVDVVSSHHELLVSVLGSKDAAKESIFYSYSKSINGFAARLEEKHAQALSKLPGVLSVFPNRKRELHTTHSWGFLGLEDGKGSGSIPPQSLWKKSNFGADIIIGNLDTGVWPESASFNDTGFGPIPSRWRGICQNGTDFGPANCNRKLIGARYFSKGYEAQVGHMNFTGKAEYLSPRDSNGHGTHTLSTAGGGFVKGASVFGFAEGTAKGGAPLARVAAYKVCWLGESCFDADILAAFDTAVYDGVDVLSVSLGSAPPLEEFFQDAIAIGAFHAVQYGRIVVCSAGNSGPTEGTVSNVAPWMFTVAASSIDRNFPSSASLGNNKSYEGQSLSESHLPTNENYPLVSSVDVKSPNANDSAGQYCFLGGLDPKNVKGKIVACLRGLNSRVEKGEAVLNSGGIGLILADAPENGNEIDADAHVLPATQLNAKDGEEVYDYIKKTKFPTAYISPAKTVLYTKPAPVMTAFSSQGPNSLVPDILKPDITAPGLSILAAFSEATSPTGTASDDRRIGFNIISGTSMACPHVSGIVASLKATHPHWSQSAIKSAIMTTAYILDNTGQPIQDSAHAKAGPLNYGAGHVDPNAAADPGLVYELSNEDYYIFLCSLGYNSAQIPVLTGNNFSCPSKAPNVYDLNYPSIAVSQLDGSVSLKRTVTNVGEASSMYVAKVQPPPGVAVTINPQQLKFSKIGEKLSFTVNLTTGKNSNKTYADGLLTWSDRKHSVTSPIVVNANFD